MTKVKTNRPNFDYGTEPIDEKKSEDEKPQYLRGETVMWQTANGSGSGIVIADSAGDFVLVAVVPKSPVPQTNPYKEQLMEGPFTVMMCVASTLWKRPVTGKAQSLALGGGQ